jgi:hypothetical protein
MSAAIDMKLLILQPNKTTVVLVLQPHDPARKINFSNLYVFHTVYYMIILYNHQPI